MIEPIRQGQGVGGGGGGWGSSRVKSTPDAHHDGAGGGVEVSGVRVFALCCAESSSQQPSPSPAALGATCLPPPATSALQSASRARGRPLVAAETFVQQVGSSHGRKERRMARGGFQHRRRGQLPPHELP